MLHKHAMCSTFTLNRLCACQVLAHDVHVRYECKLYNHALYMYACCVIYVCVIYVCMLYTSADNHKHVHMYIYAGEGKRAMTCGITSG